MAYSGEGVLIEAVVINDPNKTVIPLVCDADGRLEIAGTFSASIAVPNAANVTQVSVSDIPTLILIENPNRKGYILQNIGNSKVYISLTNSVSTTIYSFYLSSGAIVADAYSGFITGIIDIGMTNLVQV